MSDRQKNEQPIEVDVFKNAAGVAKNVRILDVLLIDTKCQLKRSQFERPGKADLSYKVKNIKVENNDSKPLVYIDIELEDKILNSKNAIILKISGTYRLVYCLNPEAEIEDENLSNFAKVNAVFNVWPYWREYVSNMAYRMGYRYGSDITIPTFRVQEYKNFLRE